MSLLGMEPDFIISFIWIHLRMGQLCFCILARNCLILKVLEKTTRKRVNCPYCNGRERVRRCQFINFFFFFVFPSLTFIQKYRTWSSNSFFSSYFTFVSHSITAYKSLECQDNAFFCIISVITSLPQTGHIIIISTAHQMNTLVVACLSERVARFEVR